jgi:hypothetical protein
MIAMGPKKKGQRKESGMEPVGRSGQNNGPYFLPLAQIGFLSLSPLLGSHAHLPCKLHVSPSLFVSLHN